MAEHYSIRASRAHDPATFLGARDNSGPHADRFSCDLRVLHSYMYPHRDIYMG